MSRTSRRSNVSPERSHHFSSQRWQEKNTTSVSSGSVCWISMTSVIPHCGQFIAPAPGRSEKGVYARRGEKSRSSSRAPSFVEKLADVARTPSTILGPEGVPVRTVGTGTTRGFAAANRAFPQSDAVFDPPDRDTRALQTGTSEDEQPSESGLVQVPDCVDQIPVEGNAQATSLDPDGVKRRVTFRRSVNVHASGGVIRSACTVQSE